MTKTVTKFRGKTARGRECLEATIDECANTVAYLLNLPHVHVDTDTGCVYASRKDCDADEDCNQWLAIISTEQVRER